jgi:hypothetical protein
MRLRSEFQDEAFQDEAFWETSFRKEAVQRRSRILEALSSLVPRRDSLRRSKFSCCGAGDLFFYGLEEQQIPRAAKTRSRSFHPCFRRREG